MHARDVIQVQLMNTFQVERTDKRNEPHEFKNQQARTHARTHRQSLKPIQYTQTITTFIGTWPYYESHYDKSNVVDAITIVVNHTLP